MPRAIECRDLIVWPSLFALFWLVSRAFAAIVIRPFAANVVIYTLWEAVILLFFVVGLVGHHVAEFRDGPGSLTAKVSEDVSVDEAWMIAVDDVYFGDVGDGGVLFKESLCVVSLRFVLGLFTLRQVMTSACASHDSLEVVDEESAEGCPGVDDAFRKGILPKEWCRL